MCHPVDARVARPSSFWFFFDGAGRRKYVFVCLRLLLTSESEVMQAKTHRYQKCASKKAIPGIFGVVYIPMIQKDRPLVARDCQFPAAQFILSPGGGQK